VRCIKDDEKWVQFGLGGDVSGISGIIVGYLDLAGVLSRMENWVYLLQSLTQTDARFSCQSACRGIDSVSFELKSDGTLLEKYQLRDATRPLSIFKYQRPSL